MASLKLHENKSKFLITEQYYTPLKLYPLSIFKIWSKKSKSEAVTWRSEFFYAVKLNYNLPLVLKFPWYYCQYPSAVS